MLSRPAELPLGPSYSFEVKFDGFRAIVDDRRATHPHAAAAGT
jgi:ATP-dependent DNA ligase